MRTADYALLKKGFLQKRVYEQDVMRKAVEVIVNPWLKEYWSKFKLWPLPGDKEILQRAAEQRSDETVRVLNMHKKGGITYVKQGGRVVAIKAENN